MNQSEYDPGNRNSRGITSEMADYYREQEQPGDLEWEPPEMGTQYIPEPAGGYGTGELSTQLVNLQGDPEEQPEPLFSEPHPCITEGCDKMARSYYDHCQDCIDSYIRKCGEQRDSEVQPIVPEPETPEGNRRNRRESWDKWNRLSEQGVPVPAVQHIIRCFAEQNQLVETGLQYPSGTGFVCPLCGYTYYRDAEPYTLPPAVCCRGCNGDSVQAEYLYNLFYRELRNWNLDQINSVIPYVPEGNSRKLMREQRDRLNRERGVIGIVPRPVPFQNPGCTVPLEESIPLGDYADLAGTSGLSVSPNPLYWNTADPRGMPDQYVIAGETFRVNSVTPSDLKYWESLEESDLGRLYILVSGTIQFVDPGCSEERGVSE